MSLATGGNVGLFSAWKNAWDSSQKLGDPMSTDEMIPVMVFQKNNPNGVPAEYFAASLSALQTNSHPQQFDIMQNYRHANDPKYVASRIRKCWLENVPADLDP